MKPLKTVLATCLLALTTQQLASAASHNTLYALEDSTNGRWCAYRDAAPWKAQIQKLSSDQIAASIDYIDQRPTTVDLTTSDESGDWIVGDLYQLSHSGQVVSLERRTVSIPDNAKRTEKFSRTGNNLIRTSSVTVDLTTKKPLNERQLDLPNLPIITTLSNFPFATLLTKLQQPPDQPTLCANPPSN